MSQSHWHIPDVESIYEETSQEQSSIEDLNLSQISIPEDLYDKLINSTKLNAVTELERSLIQLGQKSEASKQLADHLAVLLKSYKMDKILEILENVPKTKTCLTFNKLL